jgi:hypothetical protein
MVLLYVRSFLVCIFNNKQDICPKPEWNNKERKLATKCWKDITSFGKEDSNSAWAVITDSSANGR